ncbi:hypothetical protein BWI96_18900 [Siphonobacter sp. SORGH_AS_0500]|uniref:hypothetical protein n=1 Tax=Siphonobacter sp. SORGH_AS_0500 TaxID=1864824 RepID=UPI000CC67315|nr:hypothetical protein [Siphonobacter sp. SORGH_AS_0500]PKK35123.1 hypothetical protein BWI96_18900 [Siphonobacter sp. SORGH_AS_0500]
MNNPTTISVIFDDSKARGIHMCECERALIDEAQIMAIDEPEIDPQIVADVMVAQNIIQQTVALTLNRLPFSLPCIKGLFILSERQICAIRAVLVAFQVMISETLQGDQLTEMGAKELVDKAEKARKLAQALAQPVSSNS